MMTAKTHLLPPRPDMPNSGLPLLVFAGAIPRDEATSRKLSGRFEANGWQGTWTYTVYDFWHYHETGHEVLACCAGEARIGFGGEDGVEVEMRPGDVVIVPAGVGHRRLGASADFAVVGAYPPGQDGTITRAGGRDLAESRRRIAGLALPERDPVTGEAPGALAAWLIPSGA